MLGVHLSHHTSSPPPILTAAIRPVPHHTWYWRYCDRDEYKIQHVHCTVHQSFLLFLGPFDSTIPIPRIQMFLDVHTSTRIMKVLKNVPSLSGPQGGRCGRAEGHHKPLQSPGPQLAAQHQSGGDEIKAVIAAPSSGTSRYHPHCIGRQPTTNTTNTCTQTEVGQLSST